MQLTKDQTQLFNTHKNLIYTVADIRYNRIAMTKFGYRFLRSDFEFYARIGFLYAINSFDPKIGRFTTHATACMHGYVLNFIKKETSELCLGSGIRDGNYNDRIDSPSSKFNGIQEIKNYMYTSDRNSDYTEEISDETKSLLSRLKSPDMIHAVVLRYGLGSSIQTPMTYKEIVEHVGGKWSAEKVRKLVNRALKIMNPDRSPSIRT